MHSIWQQLAPAYRMGLIGLAMALAGIVVFAFNAARTPDYTAAFSGLRDEEAAAIVAKLKEAKIPYDISEKGVIKVPTGQAQEVRLLAATQGVGDKAGSSGMELFTQPRFGLTEFAEKVNYQRALENELSRTINRLDAVESSRVHVVIPQPALFAANQKEARASVVLQLKLGRRLDPVQVQGIQQLVASGVEGLTAANVSVLDTAGNVLTERYAQNDPTRQTGQRAELQAALEGRVEEDVRSLLARLLGPDKAIVRVGAELDWDQYEANTETFSPGNRAPQIRTQRETSEINQSNGSAGGVPGAQSNVPSYPGVSPGGGQAQSERRETSTTYELSRTVEKIIRAPGGVKRLSVAVALDSEVVADPNQVDAISRLVATTAGLDTARGDVVTISATPFAQPTASELAEVAAWTRQIDAVLAIARPIGMVLGPLVLLFVLRMILGRQKPLQVTVENSRETQLADGKKTALPEPDDEDIQRLEVTKQLTGLARSDPATVALIVRSWLQEDRRPS